MTTWQRNWLLVVMIVWLEANATFENLIHLFGLRPVVFVLDVLVFRLLNLSLSNWGTLMSSLCGNESRLN